MKVICSVCKCIIKEDNTLTMDSHGYCEKCFVQALKDDGATDEEIAEALRKE
jgi:alkylhydroperoxidase/carboxymuconolactone decarboxylase family protein YurZ